MSFDPEKHGFLKTGFKIAPEVDLYEFIVDGIDYSTVDVYRLAYYLTKDGDYVTIWNGLVDASMAEIALGFDDHKIINFKVQYEDHLFRGYIENDEVGAVILKAVQVGRISPQALKVDEKHGLVCYILPKSV